jgi:hypothetical protein
VGDEVPLPGAYPGRLLGKPEALAVFADLGLGGALAGDVLHRDHDATGLVRHWRGGEADREPAAIAAAVFLLVRVPPPALHRLRGGRFVEMEELGQGELPPVPAALVEIGPGVAGHGEEGVVDRERAAGVRVEHGESGQAGVEDAAEPGFALDQRQFGFLAGVDVGRGAEPAGDRTCGVAHRRGPRDVPSIGAVFPAVAALILVR